MDQPQQRPDAASHSAGPRAELDLQLVQQLRVGDEGAFRQLVANYTPRLHPYIRNVVKDSDEAEDVLQLVFWRVWQRVDSFRGESSFSTWIYRIALNAAIDWRKHRKIDRSQSCENPAELGVADDARGPAEHASSRDLSAQVRAAMLQLPEKFRTVLLLREIEGLSYEEIAKEMNIALGTVESRIFRARAKLLRILEQAGIS